MQGGYRYLRTLRPQGSGKRRAEVSAAQARPLPSRAWPGPWAAAGESLPPLSHLPLCSAAFWRLWPRVFKLVAVSWLRHGGRSVLMFNG